MAKKNVDDYLLEIGNFGLYQWLLIVFMGFLVLTYAMQMFIIVFSHGEQSFRCKDAAATNQSEMQAPCLHNSTFSNDSCPQANATVYDNKCTWERSEGDVSISVACQQFEFDTSMYPSTINSEFELICDQSHMATTINVAWMISDGVGALGGSYISDRFGRQKMAVLTYVGVGVFGSLSALSPHVVMYTICRCAMGMVVSAGFVACIALFGESISPMKRSHAINILGICWIVGSLMLPGLAYIVPNWRHLQLGISLPAIPMGIACFWPQETLLVLQKMARWNKKPVPASLDVSDEDEEKKKEVTQSDETDSEACWTIFKYRRVFVRFLAFSLGTMACSFCYYTLSFGVSSLPGSLHINMIFLAAAEGVAYIFCFLVAWLGRKWTTISAYLGGGLSLFISAMVITFAEQSSIAVTVLSMFGKFFVSGAWQIVFIWASEIYPTNHRCTLSTWNGIFSRLGSVFAPIMLELEKKSELPRKQLIIPIMYTVLMLGAGLFLIVVPDTKNAKIPDTYEMANLPRPIVASSDTKNKEASSDPGETDKFIEDRDTEFR